MAKEYKLTRRVRLANRAAATMARRGRGANWILTTIGSKTGERREVVVTPVEVETVRYLVAPFGPSAWVGNLRANPKATLARGGASIRVTAVEVEADEGGRALAKYYSENAKDVGEYMDVSGDKTITDFVAAADRYPVFRLET